MSTERFRIGGIILDAGTQEVTRQGAVIPLPPLSFNLLRVLARHAPNVVSAAQLEKEVWSGLVVDRGTINKRVLLVRNALREAGCSQDYITVVRGTGWRVAVPVERLPDGIECADQPLAKHRENRQSTPRQLWAVLSATAVVLAASLVTIAFMNTDGASDINDPAAVGNLSASSRMGQTSEQPSLAVLPFQDLSGDQVNSYLGDGIAREVISLLGMARDLDLASSTSSFAFRDPDEPVPSIAAKLGVDTILRGSLERYGERIMVRARLINSESGEILWNGNYGGSLDEVFQVQDEIASNVAMALQVAFEQGAGPDSRRVSTRNVEAFTHFLKGRSLMDARIELGSQGLWDALEQFQAAIDLDPGFDRAHVGMASIKYLLPAYDDGLAAEPYLEQAEASARYALELNPSSSEAMGVLAAVMFRRGEPAQAAALFERARELGNQDSNVLHWDALLFTSMGYFESLLPRLEEAYRLDPLNPLLGCSLGGALNLSGHPESSVAVFSSVRSFSRRDLGLALANMYLGDFESARELLRDLELWTGVLPARYSDLIVTAFEDPLQYESAVARFIADARSGELPDLLAFEALLIMGSPAAFDLEVDLSGTPFAYRLPEPVWNNWGVNLRRDPRFKNWVRALGYDRYWRTRGWPDRCRPTSLNDFECV